MELTRKKIFTAKKIAYCALFCAFGVGLPQLFHVFGLVAGQTFLPMHIPALVAGMVLGPIYGLIVGVISPIISCFATGMPVLAKMPFMVVEVGAYGFFSGLAFKFFSRFRKLDGLTIFISLIAC